MSNHDDRPDILPSEGIDEGHDFISCQVEIHPFIIGKIFRVAREENF